MKPDDIRGTPEFKALFDSLDRDCEIHKKIAAILNTLKRDMLAGDKMEKKKWPKIYIQKFGIRNLFRVEVDERCRLIYTIIAEGKKRVVCIIEFFSDHKAYNRRFGYSQA